MTTDHQQTSASHEEREAYEAPQLEELGTLTELTQGSFGGEADNTASGSA